MCFCARGSVLIVFLKGVLTAWLKTLFFLGLQFISVDAHFFFLIHYDNTVKL